MHVPISDAKAQLDELVSRAEAGDEIILTCQGRPAVRLVPIKQAIDRAARRAAIEELQASARAKATPGPCAARSQDFLYDEDGLPR
jgi:prevent-host-death family protein